MTIVFALIFIFNDQRAGGVKVGEYERVEQCREQGEVMKSSSVPRLRGGYFICVPVNATGNR